MQKNELKKLFKSLTIDEKIGQLIQLSGEFYNASDISLGPQRKLGITKKTVDLSGSVLNVAGAEKVHKIQADHLKNQKHPIPLMFMSDIVYGYKTVYPIPLGMGCSWDPQLIQKAYKNTAEEAYAGGQQIAFAPMVDLVRDARWGRVLESTGEDPYLNSKFAEAMVRGFQSQLEKGEGIVSCVKHFAAYGAVESGREYNSVDMSLSNFYQNYLPSYRAAVHAGAKMVMTSLTALNGVPSTGDKWLLQDVLRKQLGFKGIIISDYASVFELTQHGFAKDVVDAADKAIEAGVDIDMKSPCYANGLKPLLDNGRLSEDKINDASWRILELKNDLGLFENPFRGSSELLEKQNILTRDKRSLARKVSRESIVLLKNKNNLLPIDKSKKQKIALIGPYASEKELLGLWAVHGDRSKVVTIEDGFKKYVDESLLRIAKGTDIISDGSLLEKLGMSKDIAYKQVSSSVVLKNEMLKAIEVAKKSDVIIFACGEHTLQSGEAGSRTSLRLPVNQQELFNELSKIGKPIITIVISGRPLVLTDIVDKSDSLLQAWFPGIEGGNAIADIIFGNYNPSGRLSISMPYVEGQEPIYYSHLSTGRPEDKSQHVGRFVSRFIDSPSLPLFPFGFGLSYGNIGYSGLKLNKTHIKQNDNLTATIFCENKSDISCDETVQLYLNDPVSSVVQPVKRLIDFKRIHIDPKEKKQVSFQIDVQKLGFYDNHGKYLIEPGEFILMAGSNSNDLKKASFFLD